MNERIKAVRKELKLTGEKFGKSLGVSRSAIANIESGSVKVSQQIFTAIIREYGVNELWLRTGEGEMFAPQTQEEELASVVGKLLRADNPEWYKRQLILAISDMKAETILDAIEQIKKRFADQ